MNREDIDRLAREAGIVDVTSCKWTAHTDDLERFAALAAEWGAKQEREACAKACEDAISPYVTDSGGMKLVTLALAAAIRSRGEVKP